MSSQPAPRAKIRVLCVDDSEDIPEMLGRCIAAEPDMESAGSLNTAENLRAEVELRRADIVILDMKMPGSDPIAAMTELASHDASALGPKRPVRFIAYSGRDDESVVKIAADAGARAYLSKNAAMTLVLDAIRTVARGATPFRVWKSTT